MILGLYLHRDVSQGSVLHYTSRTGWKHTGKACLVSWGIILDENIWKKKTIQTAQCRLVTVILLVQRFRLVSVTQKSDAKRNIEAVVLIGISGFMMQKSKCRTSCYREREENGVSVVLKCFEAALKKESTMSMQVCYVPQKRPCATPSAQLVSQDKSTCRTRNGCRQRLSCPSVHLHEPRATSPAERRRHPGPRLPWSVQLRGNLGQSLCRRGRNSR